MLAGLLGGMSKKRRSAFGFYARFARGMALNEPGGRYLTWTSDMLREPDKREVWMGKTMRPTEHWVHQWFAPDRSTLDNQLHADQNVILLSALLVKMDMATMAASLEARSPFLDHKLAEFAASLPANYLLRNGRTKALLRDAYRGRIPDVVVNGKKRGFEIPLVSWLKGELQPILNDTVASTNARVRSYLKSSFISELLQGKVLADRNWGYLVYALLVLELWLRGEE
jgi:asparagine synthase (glutamine-hydrolysing)